MNKPKPRSTICWFCGRKLRQARIFVEVVVDGHPRILHKGCVKEALDDGVEDYPRWES